MKVVVFLSIVALCMILYALIPADLQEMLFESHARLMKWHK